MSVRIQQLKLPVTHTEQELRDRIIRTLRIQGTNGNPLKMWR